MRILWLKSITAAARPCQKGSRMASAGVLPKGMLRFDARAALRLDREIGDPLIRFASHGAADAVAFNTPISTVGLPS